MPRFLLLAAVCGLAFPAAAQVRYHATPLGTLGGASSTALAIADDGTVVGQSSLAGGGAHAFSFRDGVLRDLDPGAGPLTASAAHAVRELGWAAGTRGGEAALFQARDVLVVGGLGGGSTIVTGFDAQGRVYGRGEDTSGRIQPFRQLGDGSLQTLYALGGQGAVEAVTPGGQAFGWVRDPFGRMLPTRWTGGSLEQLELPLSPAYFGQVFAVNAQGVAVGRRDDGLAPLRGAHAAIWRGSGPAEVIPGDAVVAGVMRTSVARGINAAEQVVGQAELSSGAVPQLAAFVWAGGARHTLDDLLHNDPGVSVIDATGINRWGQIAANGSDGRALLLTPTGTLHWRGADGDRFDAATAWDSGDLGFAPNRFLSARLEAEASTRVVLRGEQQAVVVTLGETSAPGTVRLVLDSGLLKVERLDIGAGGLLGGDGRVQGELRHRGRIEVRGAELLVLEGALQHQGTIAAHDRALIVYQGEVAAGAGFETSGQGRHRFEGRFQVADGAGPLTLGEAEFAGTLRLRLGSADPLSFAAGVSFTPGAVLELHAADGLVVAAGDRFRVFRFTGPVTGRPGELHLPALPDGLAWRPEALFETGVLAVAAVPEPGALALWLAGLGVLSCRWARRRRGG